MNSNSKFSGTRLASATALVVVAFMSCACIAVAQDTTWFSNQTIPTGINGRTALRIWTIDLNNDDYPDIVTEGELYTTRKTLRLYLNQQNPSSGNPLDRVFVDVTAGSGIDSSRQSANNTDSTGRQIDIVSFADVNNDGNVDVITGCYWHRVELNLYKGDPMEVLLGDGAGHFTIRKNSGLFEQGQVNTTGISYLDFDLDGKLDVYIATWSDDHTNGIFHGDLLMLGNGDGTFNDVTSVASLDTAAWPNYGCSVTDWNNDGWPDVLTSPYCRSSGHLWQNTTQGSFKDPHVGYSAQALAGDNGQALCQWSAMPADFDNDGDMDILHVLVHGGLDAGEGRSVIEMNKGAANGYALQWDLTRLVRKIPQSSHLGDEGAVWTDIDNDGLQDVVMTECCYLPNTDRTFFFRQDTTHKLTDVTQKLGFLDMLKLSTRVAQFDYDLDGDEDLLVQTAQVAVRNTSGAIIKKVGSSTDSTVNSLAYYLLRNEIGNKNSWSSVKLSSPPPGTNRSAINARITVYVGGVAQIRDVQVGRGHFAESSPLIQNFGLGKATSIDSIVVTWPNIAHTRTVVVNPQINKLLVITGQGTGGVADKTTGADMECTAFPNPSSDYVNVTVPQGFTTDGTLSIYDALGNQVSSVALQRATRTISVPIRLLANGYYVVRVRSSSGAIARASFIKRSF